MLKKKNTIVDGIMEGLEEALNDVTGKSDTRMKRTEVINVKALREGLNMSQQEFSEAYHIPLPTLRNWEQGRRCPDATSMAYLRTIMKYPEETKGAQGENAACLIEA